MNELAFGKAKYKISLWRSSEVGVSGENAPARS